jgi:photosystem II stability/assembly factor-like uncharacterized protein
VLRSDDGGGHWIAVNQGLLIQAVGALAMHTFNRDTLYAWLPDGVYETRDAGGTWKKIPPPTGRPANTDVRTLAHSTLPGSMNTGWLYATTLDGLWLSMD